MRILVIEDDATTAAYMAKGLREAGHVAEVAATGRDGLFLALNESFDAIIADRMLPGPDGLTIVRALRASGNRTPVLMVTAMGEVEARVDGLDAGADDYLAKPFAWSELLPTELRLLEFMMRHPGQVLTRTMLLERVWDFNFDPTTNVVDVHVSRLRRKLDAAAGADALPLIRTLRGSGYMFGGDG